MIKINKMPLFKSVLKLITLVQIINSGVAAENVVKKIISESDTNSTEPYFQDAVYNNTLSDNMEILTRLEDMPKLPNIDDLDSYLNSIRKVIRFSKKNKNKMDINYSFGLFMINVNVKAALRHRHQSIPLYLLHQLQDIIHDTTELLKFFYRKLEEDKDPNNQIHIQIASLFGDDTTWVERVDSYSRPPRVSKWYKLDSKWYKLERFQIWKQYRKKITGVPGPGLSNKCLSLLTLKRKKWRSKHNLCLLEDKCYEMLKNGDDYGYALTHRLLLLLMARLGRGCAVFSVEKDKEMTTRFCSTIYAEAEYLYHMYHIENEMLDIFAEQIAACSLAGHIQFLHQSWLAQILKHQHSDGCFGFYSASSETVNKQIRAMQIGMDVWTMFAKFMNGGLCEGHLTAVAIASISAGVRLIITLTDFEQSVYK